MIPYSVVNGYSLTLDQLSTAALGDLRALLNGLEDQSPERVRRVLFEAFPEVFNPFAAAASAVSASFYEEVREMSDVGGSFAAETLDSVEAPRWSGLVGFGSTPAVFEQGGNALVYSLLSGGLTQILTEIASDTIIGNGGIDSREVGYQRVPRAGCCAFCGMLASKGASYQSKGSAEGVVGRGVPVPRLGTPRRRGGQARGIRPRGSRELGQKFHDHCRCRGVPVFEDNFIEMQADAGKYFDAYADARSYVNDRYDLSHTQTKASDGSLKNRYFYTDSETGEKADRAREKLILAQMREATGAS